MGLSQEGMATPGILCSAGLCSPTQCVPQAIGLASSPESLSGLVCTCIQKGSRAVCALVVHNAGRVIVESNFPCLKGPHLSLSNADAFAHSCVCSQCFPLSGIVGCCVRVSGRRLFSLAFVSLASCCQSQAMSMSRFRHFGRPG